MNTAEYVDQQIQVIKGSGIPLSEAAWQAALLCVGWPYIYGERGKNYCTPSVRRAVWAKHSAEQPKLKEQCKNFDGTGSCSGCKWYPQNKRVRCFDCRGFTYWILLQIFGWELIGGGCTSQWNNEANWKAKGNVADGIPQDVIVCLFYYKKDKNGKRTSTLAHTGLYFNGETCECSSGVQHKSALDKKWEVWGIPACVTGDVPVPVPPDPDKKPTLRKGDSGPYVTLAQTELLQRGYDLGSYGADGKFGQKTFDAVKAFQRDWGLAEDGIIGEKTWAMLESTPARILYTVTVPHLSLKDAEALAELHPGSRIEKEAED
jgi:hypothetical protein